MAFSTTLFHVLRICLLSLVAVVLAVSHAQVTASETMDLDDVNDMAALKQQVRDLTLEMTRMREGFAQLEEQVDNTCSGVWQDEGYIDARNVISTQYKHTFGCTLDTITLQCPLNQTINITSATYGDYAFACVDAVCCAPHPTDDCQDAMNPIDFNVLKLYCDGQTSCAFETQAQALDCGGQATVSSYLSIYHTCLPEQATDAIAFTAYASEDRSYDLGQLLLFDATLSNEGGFYQAPSSFFICPLDGLYVFTLSVTSLNNVLEASLMHEGQYLVTSRVHNSYIDQGMVVAVTECSANERVWVELGANDDDVGILLSNNTHRTSTFSGFLLTNN